MKSTQKTKKFSKKVFPNGLRLIMVPMADNPTVTVLVMVEAGSKYETKDISGLSHFLEHMCFKGTKKRPSASEISRDLDAVGSIYNAFTSQEFTGYYAKAEHRHLDKLLDVISDMYLNPTLPESEIEKEKGVIVEEINMYEDLPQKHVHDIFMELLYGNQPAGWMILGNKERVRAMTRKHFVDYRTKHYVAPATTVVVAGNINQKAVEKKIGEIFAKLPDNKKQQKMAVKEAQTKPAIKTIYKKTDQAHLVLGVRAMNAYDPRFPILKVLEGVLSGGMSSRLFQKLRDEMGVCYYVRAGEESYTDHGILAVRAGVTVNRINEVITVLLSELKRLATEPVKEAELKKVKDYMTGTLALSLESSDSLAEYYGMQEILNKEIEMPDQETAKIQAVTPKDIQKLAKELFVDESLNLAVIGPFEKPDQFVPILKF